MSHKVRWWLALVLTGCTTNSASLAVTPATSGGVAERYVAEGNRVVATTSATTAPAPPGAASSPTRTDVLALIDERVQCGRSPERCDYERLAVPESPYDRELRALMRERIDFGLRTIAGKGDFHPTVTSIRVTSVGVAEVSTCVYDALVLYDTRTIPGAHIVFNARAISIFSNWSMHLHEGRWKWFSEQVTRYAIERDAC
ncbi:MAG: hypothetical protein ACKOFZ_07530 [Ilumatobacteraceae bacterium]